MVGGFYFLRVLSEQRTHVPNLSVKSNNQRQGYSDSKLENIGIVCQLLTRS